MTDEKKNEIDQEHDTLIEWKKSKNKLRSPIKTCFIESLISLCFYCLKLTFQEIIYKRIKADMAKGEKQEMIIKQNKNAEQ